MGKAGKWVMNFLLGKKQGGNSNNKKVGSKTDSNGASFAEDGSIDTAASVVLPPQTPTHHHKRRWSFGKSSASNDKSLSRRHSTSTAAAAAITTTFNPLLQASSADAIGQLLLGPSLGNNEAVALAIHEAIKNFERKSNASQQAAGTDRRLRIVSSEHVAATRIQSAFRSYLARKALAALKALVKLQALARGHLVRKRMSATIRKMHAVMSIQVRARFQRIQMSDHSQLQREEVVDQSSKVGASPSDKKRIKRAQSGSVEKTNSERVATRRHSGDLSYLKRERPYEESSYSSTQTSPATTRHYRASQQGVSSGSGRAPVSNQDSFLEPSYMGKTQSSRAKSRSHSEPRQRPRRSISSNTRRSPSSDGTNSVQSEIPRLGFSSSAAQSKRVPVGEVQEQWFIKLYRSTVAPPSQGGEEYCCDGDREILVACEPHLNMF
ncbi:unnamed protein product [Linum tenue]|uniref:DUF4005 domain-containing protein n=1 Tax=Linum tenue TaxID=586396 RepID=A0AAV0HH25_9ROSI|nr:unnamed protein product [Linum tenue]